MANDSDSRTSGQMPYSESASSATVDEQLLAFLRSPSSYPHWPGEVHAIQTHISWVFIASPFVFKVKKPVNLGFADFSTLEKRRDSCAKELKLNRRLCPEIYLGVVPIYQSGGGFSFTGRGEIVEYALQMKELPKGRFLTDLLAKRQVGNSEVDRIIGCLQQFYAAQTPRPEIEAWGTPEKLKISTDENFSQVQPFVRETISLAAFEAIRLFTNEFYVAHEKLFFRRIQQHRILDCHGDLHLDHIHITPEAVNIFDCIEFNDRFRFIDIANDLAFLAMDFDFESRSDLATMFLRKAAEAMGDPGLLKLANFYKCYRAFVRGKVESIQGRSIKSGDPSVHFERARRYFRLALRYAICGARPLVLAIMGPVATGKSTFANQLANELEWPVFSSDRIRKTLAGVPLTERTAPELREKMYSAQLSNKTYAELARTGLAALANSSGIILDATFSSRQKRDDLRRECARAAAQLQVIALTTQFEEVVKRLKQRGARREVISDARLEDLEKLNAAYEPPLEIGNELIQVSTDAELGDSVKTALLQLARRQAIESAN